jgi:hypothetical protein
VKSSICLPCLVFVLAGCSSQAHTAEDASTPSRVDASVEQDAGQPGHDAAVRDSGAHIDVDAGSCESARLRTFLIFERVGDQRAVLGSQVTKETKWMLEGEVIGHGSGYPAKDAPDSMTLPPADAKLSYLRIRGSDREWTIIASDIPGFGVKDGTPVQASFSYTFGGFSPTVISFRLSAGGKLAFQYSAAGAVSQLDLPDGWKIDQAAELCEIHETCGSWASYAMRVAAQSGGSKQLAASEFAQLDGYTIAGSSSQQLPTSGVTPCADWFVSASELMIARSEPLGSASWTCSPKQTSTLPGVNIDFDAAGPCQFSHAQARDGIQIPYSLVVAHDVADVRSSALDIGGCALEPAGELSLFEALQGNGQFYGLRDIGGCGGQGLGPAGTLRAGTAAHVFSWDGRNWTGPSDTANPKGADFPSGVYTLSVRASGTYAAHGGDDAGTDLPFAVEGSLEILLTE